MPRLRHDSTVLASSRTLRAGFADAAGGILDEACARRSGDRQVGTKGWPLWSNNGMDRTGSRRGLLGAGSAWPGLRSLGSGEVDAEGIEPPMRLLELTVHDLQPKRDHTDMSGCRLGRAAGDRDRRLVQDPLRLFGVDATDPMRLQELGDGLLAHLDRFRGCRNQCQNSRN